MSKKLSKDSVKKTAVSSTQLIPLTERAKKGDVAVLPELRELLSQNPELWQAIGNGAWRAEQSWIHVIAGDDQRLADAIRQEQKKLKKEMLLATGRSRLERIQIDRIMLDQLQLSAFEADLARATAAGDIKAAKRASDQLHRAHTRLMASVRTLGVVRKIVCDSPLAFSAPFIPRYQFRDAVKEQDDDDDFLDSYSTDFAKRSDDDDEGSHEPDSMNPHPRNSQRSDVDDLDDDDSVEMDDDDGDCEDEDDERESPSRRQKAK